MSRKIVIEFALLIATFLAIWLVFIYLPLRPEAPETALSIEQEQNVGDILIASYLERITMESDSTVAQTMNQIYQRLLSGMDSTEYDYHIYIVKNENINAFASLGGHIVVFTGLLDYADSPEEVAAVLAHEMGHVEKRHVVNKVVKELGIGIILSVLSGGDAGFLNKILQQSISAGFDRTQESEADDYGLRLLEKSQIHPNAMAAIFSKIRDKYGSSTYEALDFLSSHPNTNKRIKKSLNYKTSIEFQSKAFDDIDWQKLKESL